MTRSRAVGCRKRRHSSNKRTARAAHEYKPATQQAAEHDSFRTYTHSKRLPAAAYSARHRPTGLVARIAARSRALELPQRNGRRSAGCPTCRRSSRSRADRAAARQVSFLSSRTCKVGKCRIGSSIYQFVRRTTALQPSLYGHRRTCNWPLCDRRRTGGHLRRYLDFGLLGNRKRVIDLDTKVTNGALELCVTEQ
jgi:hypothetical protein